MIFVFPPVLCYNASSAWLGGIPLRSITVLLLIACTVCSYAGSLKVTTAYYRDTNASLHLFLQNSGREPVSVLPPVVDGIDCASLGRDGKHVANVLWYRCRPNPIGAGEIADLTITLAAPTDNPVTVELSTSSGEKLRKTIRCAPEQIRFQAIRFSRDLRTVDLYMRTSKPVRRVCMDGREVAKSCKPFNGIAFTRIELGEPLVANSFHTFEAEADGASTAYQIRAIPEEFLIGVYGGASPENIADWKRHGFDHHISFGAASPDQLGMFAEHGMSVGSKYIKEHLVDRADGSVPLFDEEAARESLKAVAAKPNLVYHHLVDEPDVCDYYAGRILGATAMELVARGEFFELNDGGRYSFVQIDNTFRPNNYRVYGEITDVLATHRYSLGNHLKSEAGESTVKRLPFFEDMAETLDRFRATNEPKPFFMVPQFFNLGVGRAGRPPSIDEMRLQCYLMVAGGARGFLHYIHSGSTGGGEGGRTPALMDGMTGLNAELRLVGDVVASGTPAPSGWAKCSSSNLLPSVVLNGDRMAVILLNLSHRSSLATFVALPVRGARVDLPIPPWMDASSLEVLPVEGGNSLTVTRDKDGLHITVDEVAVARCLIVRPRR